jgi:hypothetical protein
VNGHARFGDGSDRAADFTKVSLADLGESLQAIARQDGSQLHDAIEEAVTTGTPSIIRMTEVRAGGGIGGKTPIGQQGGIGRFSVRVTGTVRAEGKHGWVMSAWVRGEVDRQDYVPSNRNPVGEALTRYGKIRQRIGGGKDYNIYFYGQQRIIVHGRR